MAAVVAVAAAAGAIGLAVPIACAADYPEYAVKAAFVEEFGRFVQWPEAKLGGSEQPFVIGVLGEDPIGPYLEALERPGQSIQGKPVDVRALSGPEAVDDCHIVWIAASERGDLPEILKRTAERAILTVSDTQGFAEQGVVINLQTVQGRVRIQVNLSAARRSGLELSSDLLRLASIVEPDSAR